METTIIPLVTKFWNGLGIIVTDITVKSVADDIDIRIQTPDSPIIIGIHGKNIEIFQHLLGRLFEKALGKFVHVHLEVNDYVKMRDEKLFRLIDGKINVACSSNTATRITNLSPYDRKKAHSYIAEKHLPGLSSHSEGEGSERALVIEYTGKSLQELHVNHGGEKNNNLHQNTLTDDGIGI